MDLTDTKYIGLVSSRLPKFKKVKPDLYNFRCPLCGDSQKQKNKARGYIYAKKADANYKCHNCGASTTFSNFLKILDSTLYKQYIFEKFQTRNTGKGSIFEEPKLEFKKPVFRKKLDLPKASEVKIAKQYLENRKLDPTKFYYTDKFKEWTNTQKQTFDYIGKDEPRIIIPMYDTEQKMIGFQGRSLIPNSVKYITIMIDEEAPKIYGLDKINKEKPIYIIEGPFDSSLVENSIAMCGADVDIGSLGWSDYIWVYDNEPRSREITDRIRKTLDRGDKVVIWPTSIEEKDVNDMILGGHDVMGVLKSNTYSGLKAKIKFNNWKKI
ncbi:DNA primase subunit [Prochlorococcus phage P-SSM2]|uniref:DNA primase subunit n=1 Tax=Prochlorococcus phage P-SSM2 TaxID=268746 RepID=Q58ME8_BPPRM|nr:DNA primase [Prochlorococcus phage P-SSM2]AAX44584.1 DNA primase subunit [Prochlorococcus phage P-SSM2]ACY76087.1 DNA primase subunit gp61 [Prochlorococcus phage P-SSM2]